MRLNQAHVLAGSAAGIRRQLVRVTAKSEDQTCDPVGLPQANAPANRRISTQGSSLKGGDPAAGSPTATLLRLHPSL